MKGLRTAGLHFRFIDGHARIQDGVMAIEDWQLMSSPLRLDINGDLDLVQRQYDLEIRARPLQTVDELVAAVPLFGYLITGKDKAFTDLRYYVTGPWSAPRVQSLQIEEEKGFWERYYERVRKMRWRDLVPWREEKDDL